MRAFVRSIVCSFVLSFVLGSFSLFVCLFVGFLLSFFRSFFPNIEQYVSLGPLVFSAFLKLALYYEFGSSWSDGGVTKLKGQS